MELTPSFIIEDLREKHWPEVEKIYLNGIKDKMATFETNSPGWESWNHSHHQVCRYVLTEMEEVIGWAALSPVSARKVYSGVAEVSIYIAKSRQKLGLGKKLLTYLIDKAEKNDIWTLQVSLFPENKASYALHLSCGFREVGYREKIGKLDDMWRNTLLMERRSKLSKFQ